VGGRSRGVARATALMAHFHAALTFVHSPNIMRFTFGRPVPVDLRQSRLLGISQGDRR
jgi:hypothetical protein